VDYLKGISPEPNETITPTITVLASKLKSNLPCIRHVIGLNVQKITSKKAAYFSNNYKMAQVSFMHDCRVSVTGRRELRVESVSLVT
jgi:hypothetical protein